MNKCLAILNREIKSIEILHREIHDLERKLSEHENILHINNRCVVCMCQPKNYANIECGHMSVCYTCSPKINNKCPICRTEGKYIHIRWDGFNNKTIIY
jgi:hypothetical protein